MFENLLGKRWFFLLIFAGVTAVLVGTSYWVITFVYGSTQPAEQVANGASQLSQYYVNFDYTADEYISAEAYLAMGEYQTNFPEPQNVQVLVGEPTVNIIGYMINYYSAGLGVGCVHCHSLENFAADEWGDTEAANTAENNKYLARQHTLMSQDLNQTWLAELDELTPLKQPTGTQIICATCHYAQPIPVTYPEGIANLPDWFRLPLDEAPFEIEEEDYLDVNARWDVGLDRVQTNQWTMYHMNVSMNVGCTHCHNSRYFPSNEVPAKYYAGHMLNMTADILTTWGPEGADVLGNSQPSCWMCHNEAVIPGGGLTGVDQLPLALRPDAEAGSDERANR